MQKFLLGLCVLGGVLACVFFLSPSKKDVKLLGIYDSSKSVRPSFNLESFYSNVGIVAKRYDWEKKFPKKFVIDTLNQQSIPFIFWEPIEWYDRDLFNMRSITNGIWDEHISKWAKDVKEFEYPVFICFASYPDQGDSPWGKRQGDDWEDLYKRSYRYLKEKFIEEGARNAIWVWGISTDAFLLNQEFRVDDLYPGDDVIDWVMIKAAPNLPDYKWDHLSLEAQFNDSIAYFNTNATLKPVLLSGIPLTDITDLNAIEQALTSSLSEADGVLFELSTLHKDSVPSLVSSSLFKFNTEKLHLVSKQEVINPLYITDVTHKKWNSINLKSLVKGSAFLDRPSKQKKASISVFKQGDGLFIEGIVIDGSVPSIVNSKEGLIENGDSVKLTVVRRDEQSYGVNLRDSDAKVWNYSTFSEAESEYIKTDGETIHFLIKIPSQKSSIKSITCRITDVNSEGQKLVYKINWNEVLYEIK